MAGNYIALIHKERDSDYGISFPDLPGCVSAVDSLDAAPEAAREALALHLEGLVADGDAIPEPSGLEQVMALKDAKGAVPVLVPAPVFKAPAVRVNVTLPQDLLEAIDRAAGPGGRSAFLAEAARSRMSGAVTAQTMRAPEVAKPKRKTRGRRAIQV